MKELMDKLLTNKWQKMDYWWGNPDLGYECWGRKYKNNIVYIFGKEGVGKNKPCYDYTERDENGFWKTETRFIREYKDFTDWSYCVQHLCTGSFSQANSAKDLMNYLDFRDELNLITSGRSLTDKELDLFYFKYNE